MDVVATRQPDSNMIMIKKYKIARTATIVKVKGTVWGRVVSVFNTIIVDGANH